MNADETFEKLIQEMLDRLMEKNPDYATQLGLHEPYDSLLPSGATENLIENLQLLEETLKRLNNTLKREELNDQHKVDWEVIEQAYEQWKFIFYEQRTHESDPDAFTLLGSLLFIMFTRNYAPLEKRMEAIAARIEKAPKFLEEFRSRFENKRPVKLWTEIAIETAQNMEGFFQFMLFAAKGQVSDKVYERLGKALENLQPAFKIHMEWLNSLLPKARED
jgi:hypothetical protein